MMRKVKFQEGGMASSGISNEPVGAALRRLFERRAPMQGPPAPGGGQRPQEDRARMAEEAAPRFDEEERMLMERRRNRGSAITNQPVGERLAGRRPAPAPEPSPAPMGDYAERMQRGALPAGRSAAPGPMGEYGERAAAGATPPRPRAAPRPMAREATTAEDLNEIVLRLTRGEKPVTETEKRIADRMGIAYKKGGMVNKYQEGGRIRQGIQSPRAQEARAEMAEDVMKRARKGMGEGPPRRVPNSMLTPEEQRERNAPLTKDELDRMRGDAYKKGGMVKPKKMKAGGKVAPKKMMKGGIVAKPKAKKMMGGGRAMYAKGGMAKGCK